MNKRGFLLTEVAAYAFLTMLLVLMSLEMLTGLKNIYAKTESESELHENAMTVQHFIEARLYGASSITAVTGTNGRKTAWGEFSRGDVDEISFKFGEENVGIYLNRSTNKLFCIIGGAKPGYEFANYVSKMTAEKIQDESGVRLVLLLEKNNCSMETEFLIFIRNCP